jgi:nicotinate (nicotinamide) nucleotide adenylyltransferase
MLNIALFGGGFDPISLHHEKIAETVKEKTGMSTWTMPCYGHLFSKDSRLESAEHRWNMVSLTKDWRNDDVIIPFDWEIKHKHTGSMFETIQSLKKEYKDITFHIVIGMDNANLIEEKWHHGSLLIKENPFIVFEREGSDAALWTKQHKVYKMDYNLSSTEIRDAIKRQDFEFAEQHLNPAVFSYIKTNNLYQTACACEKEKKLIERLRNDDESVLLDILKDSLPMTFSHFCHFQYVTSQNLSQDQIEDLFARTLAVLWIKRKEVNDLGAHLYMTMRSHLRGENACLK